MTLLTEAYILLVELEAQRKYFNHIYRAEDEAGPTIFARAKFSFPFPSTLLPVSLKQRSSMKRIIPSDFSTRTGRGRGFHEVHNIESCSGEAKNRRQEAPIDTGCRKRLKFSHVHEKDPLGCRPEDSSSWKKANSGQKSSEPKTSEYAFFQKIKEGVSHKFQSDSSMYVKRSQSELFWSDEGPGGSSVGLQIADKDAVSLLLDENVMPLNFNTFSSPVEPTPEETADQGLSHNFAKDGEDLHHWMTNTSSCEVDELYSKWICYMDKDDNKLSPDWNLKPLLFYKDIHKESQKSSPPPEPFNILDVPCWDYESPPSWWSKSAKGICSSSDFSWRESEESGFTARKNGQIPLYLSDRIFSTMDSPERKSKEADIMLGNFRPTLPNPVFESISAFPVKGYDIDSFSSPNDFHGDSNTLLPDRKSMLQCISDSDKHEIDFFTSPNAEPICVSRLLSFGIDDHQQWRNGRCDLSVDTLPLRSDCSEEFCNHNSNSYCGQFDEPDPVTSMNHLHLSVSCYLNLPKLSTTGELDGTEDGRVLQQQHSHSDASSIW